MPKIKGGYYLKAKKFQDSWIAKAPPHVREIWDLFLRKAFYKDMDTLNRGQLLITYSEIIEELAWFVGYRKMTYKKHHCEIAMKALLKQNMIATTKTTRGVIVTVLNYDRYQTVENYECYTTQTANTTMKLQCTATIEKEVKEKKEKKEKPLSDYSKNFETFWNEYPNKQGKAQAFTYWKKYKCDNGIFETIMESLRAQRKSDNWKKNNGQFIPMGSTWVTGRRWEDHIDGLPVVVDQDCSLCIYNTKGRSCKHITDKSYDCSKCSVFKRGDE